MFDVGMSDLTLLALGLACAGKPAQIRADTDHGLLVRVGCQNYAAADVASPRTWPPTSRRPIPRLVVDRVVAVIRRHVLGDDERSVWAALGRAVLAAARLRALGLVLLYVLRLVLAPPSTAQGLRRWFLS